MNSFAKSLLKDLAKAGTTTAVAKVLGANGMVPGGNNGNTLDDLPPSPTLFPDQHQKKVAKADITELRYVVLGEVCQNLSLLSYDDLLEVSRLIRLRI